MSSENNLASRGEQLEKMKRTFEAERAKHGYDIDDPVDPVRNKSGAVRMIGAILLTAIVTAGLALLISMIASNNCGAAVDFGALLGFL